MPSSSGVNTLSLKWRKKINRTARRFGPDNVQSAELSSIALWPKIDHESTELQMSDRIDWYLVDSVTDIEVYYSQSDRLSTLLSSKQFDSEQAQFNCIEFNRIKKKIDDVDRILVYDVHRLENIRVVPHISRVRIIDPSFYSTTELDNWLKLSYECRTNTPNQSSKNFERLLNIFEDAPAAYAIGPGPSSKKIFSMDIEDQSVTLICNSLIRNQELNQEIEPDILVYTDPVFFGPSEYSSELREDTVSLVNQYGSFLFVPEKARPLMRDKYPSIESKLIGLEMISSNKVIFPSPNRLEISYGFVLPKKMLPIASTITDTVYILGADGYSEEDVKKSYNDVSDASEKEQNFDEWHPSYIRDQGSLSAKNRGNERDFRKVIEHGRKRGVNYVSRCRSEYEIVDALFISE